MCLLRMLHQMCFFEGHVIVGMNVQEGAECVAAPGLPP